MKEYKINKAEFVKSSTNLKECPDPKMPEYAFIGRSNVGKSSLINLITGRKNLAKISTSPGKTKCINHFLINEQWYLVDLPGYGFAKVSKTERENWGKLIHQYLVKRKNLLCTFLLVDSRHEVQKSDNEFIEWMGMTGLPFVLIFTKSDKLSKKQLADNLMDYRKALKEKWAELPEMIVTSAKTGKGKEAIIEFIAHTKKIFKAEDLEG